MSDFQIAEEDLAKRAPVATDSHLERAVAFLGLSRRELNDPTLRLAAWNSAQTLAYIESTQA
jgi:hypothetical protein